MRLLTILSFVCLACNSFAQTSFEKNDFFELGVFTGTFQTDGVEFSTGPNSTAKFSTNVFSYGLNIKYGKAFLPFAHLVFGGGFGAREEAILRSVEVLPNEVINTIENQILNSYHINLGPRFRIIGLEVFEWSLGGGGFARLTPRSENDQLAGYYVQSVFGVNFTPRIQLNASYGYEKVANADQIYSFPLGLAFHYKIY